MADLKTLNPQQLEAVNYGDGPLLIIAGAGTGKTTVVTERIKNLILEKKINPSEILALTFTEKAAKEMEERIDIIMPYGYTQMWISTFHSFCDRILRNESIHIGLNSSYKLLTEAESVLFLRKNIFKFNLDYFRPLGNPDKFLEGMLQHFSRLKDEDISPNEYLRWAQVQSSKFKIQSSDDAEKDEIRKIVELADAYKHYQELKAREGVMDFSDLIGNTLKLFRERKNILKNYESQFKYILVDEFQDTNYAQNELTILLSGERKNITVVADDDQAIYRWRGAAISNVLQFKKCFKEAKIISLVQNYRSTQNILDASYKLIQNNNPDRLEIKENISKKLISERRIKGNIPELLFAQRVEDEADLVVKKINELITKKNYDFKNFAILVRANEHANAFVRAFERNNIPYQFLGPGKLFHEEGIKDLIAYLKVLYNFEDSVSLYRILVMPIFGLESLEVAALLNFSRRKNLALFQTLEQAIKKDEEKQQLFLREEAKEKIKKIYEMIKRHLGLVPNISAPQILYYFLQDSGLLKKLLESSDERKSQDIARFFDKLKCFEVENEDARVFAVVDWIDLSIQMGESPKATDIDWSENNAVNILTIHSSKGLEFSVVFLVNLVTNRFPTRERQEQIPIPQELIKEILPIGDFHLQEERRLFYVGATRAKDYLFLTAANFYGEGKRERKISPFVYEIIGEDAAKKLTMKQSNNEAIKQLSFLEEYSPQVPILNTKYHIPYTINYLSYSQIKTFEICPLHYKLRYIHRIPTSQTSAQSFGTSVHATLRDFYQSFLKGEKIKPGYIELLLKKVWINEGYASYEHEKSAFEKAKLLVTDYIKINSDKQNPLKIAALETPFQFFIKNPTLKSTPLKVGGRIDRIDVLENGKIEILDYKTGKNMPDENKLAKDLQLTFYALAATKVNDRILSKKPEEVVLSFYYLEMGKKITTTRTKKQLEEAEALILQKAEEIEKSDFQCSKGNFCVNCEYKMLCSTPGVGS